MTGLGGVDELPNFHHGLDLNRVESECSKVVLCRVCTKVVDIRLAYYTIP